MKISEKIVSILFIASTFLPAQEKRAMTFDDFFSMKRLGGFALSPDQTTVAYDVTVPDIEGNSFKTDIWLLDLGSGVSRKFTTDEKSSSGPVWSADSQTLYFNHRGQIFSQSVNADSALQITDFAGGAAGPVLNPNGREMIWTSEIYPETDLSGQAEKMSAVEANPVKARVIDGLMYRQWNRWLEGKRSHVLRSGLDGLVSGDLTPGDYDSPPLDLGGNHDYVYSPDGKEVCFVRNMDKMVAASTNNDLFIHNLKTGAIVKITDNPANDNDPAWAPNGKLLAYKAMSRPGFEADRYRLMLFDLKKNHTELTVNFPNPVGMFEWTADSRAILFLVEERGFHGIYSVDLKSKVISKVFGGHFINSFRQSADGRLLLSIQTARMPSELFSYNLQTKELKQITFLNNDLLTVLEMNDLESFWFKGANDDSVQGFILKPPFFDPKKKYPAIQLIHGGPQGSWGDDFHFRWNYQMFAANGHVVYVINFHGSTGYGQNFTDVISGNWGGAPYQDILLGTRFVTKKFTFIDADKQAAAGASYGGFMVNWILGGAEQPFKCLVSHDGVYDQRSMYGATEELWFPEWEFNGTPWKVGSLYERWSPSNRAGNFKTPTLVIHGENDFRVPYTQGLQLFTALQRQEVPSRLLIFPDEDHFVRKPQNARLWWSTVHDWIARYTK